MDTWRQDEATGDAIVDYEDETGEILPIRVPWEHRSTSIGWGRNKRARWKHPITGAEHHAVIVSEGRHGVLARDEAGVTHALPHESYETLEWPKQVKPLAKADRTWIAAHTRGGHAVIGHWREIKPGDSFDMPQTMPIGDGAQHWLGGRVHVDAIEGGMAHLRHEEGGRVQIPHESVPHYVNDLSGHLPHPPTSGTGPIDQVLRGEGQYVGKGNDGIVHRAGDHAVKISTTVPFQPHNFGHRTPAQAVAHLRHEVEAHEALADLPMVPKVHGQEHDGRYFIVKPWYHPVGKLQKHELRAIGQLIESMHARGWTLNDLPQFGRDDDGKLWVMDLGQAHPNATQHDMERDRDRLNDLYREHGEHRLPEPGPDLDRQLGASRQLLEWALEDGAGTDADRARIEHSYSAWKELHKIHARSLRRSPDAWMDAMDEEDRVKARYLAVVGQPQTLAKALRLAKADEVGPDGLIHGPWKKDLILGNGGGKSAEDHGKGVLTPSAKGGGGGKKHPPIPPGGRWITVHPNGPGTTGQAILIVPAGDGTHRVIGGAGGSMNHLRLRNVGSEEEGKARAKDRQKAERERRKKMSPEDRAAEDAEKKARQDRVHQAERKVVEAVRAKWGGVDEDLNEEDLDGLSEKAKERVRRNHHRRQFAQAMKARKDIATTLADERMEQIEDEAAVDRTIREEPDLMHEAHAVGQQELAQIEAEEEERKARRTTPVSNRADAEERARMARETALTVLQEVDRDAVKTDLDRLGGRSGMGETPKMGETASAEQRRRAVEAIDNAVILADAAAGVHPTEEGPRASLEFEVVRDALAKAGIDPGADRATVAEALANEARIAMEQAQLAKARAEKYEALEKAGNGRRALKMQLTADVMRGLTAEVRDATRRLGLRDDAKTPLKQAEIAEMVDVLSSFDELRRAKAGLDEVTEKAEGPKSPTYDKSRRAFQMHLTDPPDHVIEEVEEQVRRELATRIIGMADEKASAHAKAVADGHYAKLADISLAVSNASHIDRPVVDALGLKNAGVLLRHALEEQGHDPDVMHNALIGHHVREQTKLTADALAQADAFVPGLEDAIHDTGDIEHALKKLDASEADLAQAQRAIGGALGQMEATATLAQTFRGKQPEHLSIELKDGGTSGLQSHVTWLTSIGLAPGDYQIDTEAKEIRIPKASWSKLVRREPEHVVEQRKLVHAIKRGEHDEDGWMPKGMVSRSSTSFTDPPPESPRYHRPLNLDADDIRTELGDHIGSRLADGERPADIARDLMSAQVAGKAADPEAFADLAREFFPLSTEEDRKQEEANAQIHRQRGALVDQYNAAVETGDGDKVADLARQIAALPKPTPVQAKRDVHFADHYEKLSRDFLRRHHPDADTLHATSLYGPGVDEGQVREALLRSLADHPEHAAAFVPIGEMTAAHQQALQDYFYKRAGISDTRDFSAEFGQRKQQLVDEINSGAAGSDPPAGGGGLFGGGGGGGLFGGGAPPPPAEKLSPDTIGKLHPKEAKALAYEYPREGRELHRQAMGERPAEPTTPSKLHPDVHAAIDAIRERHPAMDAAGLAKAAALHIGRQKAMAEAGVTAEQLQKTDPVTGELTPTARRLVSKIETRAADLQQRGIDPREVHRVYGGKIHDAESEEFERHAAKHDTPWRSFVDMHGDRGVAYQALQAEMRGEFTTKFAAEYGKATGKSLQTTIAEVPNAELHSQALASPAKRQELAAQRREELQKLRERSGAGATDAGGKKTGGQFAAGSALERYRQAKDAERSHGQRQSGLFGAAPAPPGKLVATTPAAKRDPGDGERHALGSRAENEIQALLSGNIGKTLDPSKPVRLFAGASMDGRRVASQRVIKQLRAVKRVGAWLGTGSGKTPTSIGAFTDLHATGDTTHGLFLVPTAVQGQFGEEMLSFTEPGKYMFQTGQGKNHHERVAMLQDKGTHMRVLTHQSAARTVLRMTADHHGGIAPEAMLERLRGMSDKQRAQTVREALDAHGIPRHMTYVDEAHGLTTRQGQQETDTAIIIGAMTHPINATHALLGSATPHKNDTSEVHSMARLIDPDRYSDAYRFTQAYGQGSVAAPDAVRREMDANTYTDSIPPDGVQRIDTANPVIGPDGKKTPGGHIPLTDEHRKHVDGVTQAYERATAAHRRGDVDVEATRKLSPDRFAQAPEAEHEQIARDLAPHLGIVKETALRKALQLAPIEHNAKLRRMVETIEHDLKAGKPSIVFTDSAEEAHHVQRTLHERGHGHTGVYHGGLDENARDQFRAGFKNGAIKVGIMTAAGEAGINLQTAKTIHHYDVPKTAKSWSQRNGRAYRQGQKDNVDVHDWTHDHEAEHAAVRRLQDKSRLADVFQTPLGPLDEHGFARDYFEMLNQKHQGFSGDEARIAAK